jgi:hypothetical protein
MSETRTKAANVSMTLSAPNHLRLPTVRLPRKSKGFVNIPLLRLIVVPAVASASAGSSAGKFGG